MVSRPRNGLSLCAGAGGLDLGLMLAEPDFHTRCFVEWEEHPRDALIAGQRAGYFAPAPIWDDVTTFDGRPYRGAIDTILAGYPCQPFSQAGQRKGENDERHLWPEIARIIREIEPRWVFLENVAGHVTLGAETVLRELWGMGWTPAAGLFSAEEVGAPHERLRWFCVAYRAGFGEREQNDTFRAEPRERSRTGFGGSGGGFCGELDNPTSARCNDAGERPETDSEGGERLPGEGRDHMAHAGGTGPQGQQRGKRNPGERQDADGPFGPPGRTGLFPPGPTDTLRWLNTIERAGYLVPAVSAREIVEWAGRCEAAGIQWESTPECMVHRMADGIAHRTRALRILGNGVVPLVAGYAWRTLSAAHGLGPMDLATAGTDGRAGTDAADMTSDNTSQMERRND